jgi:hypothetical protein
MTKLFRNGSVQTLMVAVLFMTACQTLRPRRATLELPYQSLRCELPASLEHERILYEKDVITALGEVSNFFLSSGFELPDSTIIDSVTVFESSPKARAYLADAYGASVETIPQTFSGTVIGRKLFLVSRETYQAIWQKVYAEWPWTEENYHELIVHELTHRAHEEIAVTRYGSAEAMGPTWFFEGLAITCAGQFDKDEPLLNLEELKEQVGSGRTPKASYPLCGRITRSLAAKYGIKVLVAGAAKPGFPDILWSRENRK